MTKDLSVQSQNLDESAISPAPSPHYFSLIDSDNEFDEDDESDEENHKENSMFSNDINEVSFGEQSKTESEWKLKDGRLIVDVLNTKTTEMVKLVLEKDKNERTQFMKSVIRYVLIFLK